MPHFCKVISCLCAPYNLQQVVCVALWRVTVWSHFWIDIIFLKLEDFICHCKDDIDCEFTSIVLWMCVSMCMCVCVCVYIYTYIHTHTHTQWNLGSRTPLITNKFSGVGGTVSGYKWCFESRTHKPATTVDDKLGVSVGERQLLCNFRSVHIPARIRLAFSWISLCLWFICILLIKTPWDQRSFGLHTFWVMNGLQERIIFVNWGSTVCVCMCVCVCVCVCVYRVCQKNIYTIYIITVAICSRTFAQKMPLIKWMRQAEQSKKMAEAQLSFEERKTITILIQFFPFLKCV
jgi:hypothetical protein